MDRKSVAVLDIRSSEICILIGERGVNNTFVFKASKTEPYDGYDDTAFFDIGKLADAISRALTAVEQICDERVRELFVGVPGAFTRVLPKEQVLGFPKRRRIGQKEIDALFASGKEELDGYRFIRATSMIYVTGDNRRVVNPVGLSSEVLSGVLSYFYCSDYFAEAMESIFADTKIALRFLPAQLAMASYLIPSETRDEYALFFDAGYMSSTLCVLMGNGILSQKTYFVGKGQIAVRLMQRFALSYDAAVALLARANLFSKDNAGRTEFSFRGETYDIDLDELVECVKEGLDEMCEAIGGFLEDCSSKELDYKPLYISGEGLADIRGALEHISKRVSRICEQLAPDLPYYNKPAMSSRIALLAMAYDDHLQSGWLNKLLNVIFGG